MLRLLGLVLATILSLPFPAAAQNGQRVFDFLLQGAQQEINRQQQRDYERQQRQHLNQLYQLFLSQWQACHAGDLSACNSALSYPYASANDQERLLTQRAQIIAAQQEAADHVYRQRVQAEYQERRREEQSTETRLLSLRQSQDADSESPWLSPGAFLLALIAAGITLTVGIFFGGSFLQKSGWTERLALAWVAAVASVQQQSAKTAPSGERADTVPGSPAAEPAAVPQPTPSEKPRDTPGAISVLELALAYIEEVRGADRPGAEDVAERKHQLNTLALAAKQLDLAAKLDPDAVLEGQSDDVAYRFSINELKAEALLLEGMTHQVYDLRRAIPALISATKLNPKSPRAFYVLGLTYAANKSKANAVSAFEQAVALDPKNIAYRKELNRAQSLSAAEIAGYRVTRAGERTLDAAITSWNVFAVIWNVVMFPIRVMVGIFRYLRLAGFH